jgi:hypothetical protein
MFGLFLVATSQIFAEIGIALGKKQVEHKEETVYEMGFLNAFWSTLIFIAWCFIGGSFIFVPESIPFFLLRAALEVILLFTSLHAVIDADRSTFAFLRLFTIPAVLFADVLLGYTLPLPQALGILLVAFSLLFLVAGKGLSPKGKVLTVVSALIAAGTITLFKYNITHYNSVEAEEALMHGFLLTVIVTAGLLQGHQNVFRALLRPKALLQSAVIGASNVMMGFAYAFAPASVITSSKCAIDVLLAIISGRAFFHENKLLLKLGAFATVAAGLTLIALYA